MLQTKLRATYTVDMYMQLLIERHNTNFFAVHDKENLLGKFNFSI